MKSIFLIRFGYTNFGCKEEIEEGFCFESYGEAATFLNEVEGMFIKDRFKWDNHNTFYKPDNNRIWAEIVEIPVTRNKLERKGWFD